MEKQRKYTETLTEAIHRLENELIELAGSQVDQARIVLDELNRLRGQKNVNAAFQRALMGAFNRSR